MFHKAIMAAVLVVAAVTAKADFLYWQIDASDPALTGLSDYNMALVNVYDSNSTKTILAGYNTIGGGMMTTGTDLGNYVGAQYSFSLELVNYTQDTASYSSVKEGMRWSYNDLYSSGYISPNALSQSGLMAKGAWNGISAVPEPSSGLLLLIGGALVGLRRRRRA